MVASIKYKEHTSLSECRCRELGTVMTDSMKKYPVHCEATVTTRRFEKDKFVGEYHDSHWSRSWNNKLKMIMHGNNFPTSTGKKGKPQE